MAYEDGTGFKRVKIVDGTGDKTFIKVKQVDDTSVKNYVNVKESDEASKDYTEVQVVTYDKPKDYLRVNFFSGGIVPPDPVEPRWYWDMLSPSYAAFPEAVNIEGAFSHKLTGKFSSSSFHLLSNQGESSFRVFLSGTSYNLFAGTTVSNSIPVVSLGQTIRQSLETGVHTLEYGRDSLGEWFVKIDGVSVGSTVNLFSDFVSYNTFGSEVEGSSVPSFNNYHWNHEIKGVRVREFEYPSGELIMPFDEGYNAEHESLEESNNLIVRKVGDIAARYTQTEPV